MRRGLIATAAVALLALCLAPPAGAKHPLRMGIFDGLFRSSDDAERQRWLDQTEAEGSELVLTAITWSNTAPTHPGPNFDPRDPADPAYSWGTVDDFVIDASARGLEPVLSVHWAPAWAEGAGRPDDVNAGTWKPDPDDLRDFAEAVATRYSGSFVPPGASEPLPRVRYYQAWAEPNLNSHLTPQWDGKRAASPAIYRGLLNSFYAGVKAVDGSNQVITGGTGPYGDDPGGERMRPLRFWRDTLCISRESDCAEKPHFDILAHDTISTSGPPQQSAINRDDVTTPDLPALQRLLRKAERAGTVAPGGRHPLWVTEFWWTSSPPSSFGYRPAIQARYIAESLYLFWKAGAEAAIYLRIRDGEPSAELPGIGLYYLNGKPKPSALAYRFPFVADSSGKGKRLRVWGKAPVAGKVTIERKSGRGWRRIGTLRAGRNRIFAGKVRQLGRAKLRARAGGEASFVWKLR